MAVSGSPAGVADMIGAELRGVGIPGASVAVVDRRGIVWADGFGAADAYTGRPATADTNYHLYSGTKLYTAAAVLQLAAAKLVMLDAPAAEYLPDVLGGLGSCRPTLRQLLSHTSGLADTLRAFLAVHEDGEHAPTASEALSRFRIRCQQAPGATVAYRNVNYALLGEIVARRGGRPYTEFVREQLLCPLAMRVAYGADDAMRRDLAVGYIGAWEPLRFIAPFIVSGPRGGLFGRRIGRLVEIRRCDLDTAAVGGLVGSVTGFAPFVVAQLGGAAPLDESIVRAMQTLAARGAAGISSRVGMGLGWKIGDAGGVRFLNHEGGGPGFTSETRIYPEVGLGMVICMNRWVAPKASHLVAHRICEWLRQRAA